MNKSIKFILILVSLIILFLGSKFFFINDIFKIQTKIFEKYPNLQIEFRENLFGDLFCLFLQRRNFFGDVDAFIVAHPP